MLKFVENIWGYLSAKYNFDSWVRNINSFMTETVII